MTVSVDDNFARFGAKSYAIDKINSLEVRESAPHGKGGAILCGIIAAICIFAWLGGLASPEGPGIGTLIVGAVLAFVAWKLWEKSKTRLYQLFVMTSSSEAQAFVSHDQDEVWALRSQIEAAMLRQSR